MTIATEIASIVKPLEWNKYGYAEGSGGTYNIIGGLCHNGETTYALNGVWCDDFFRSPEKAKQAAQYNHIKKAITFIDPAKISPKLEVFLASFWKPIEQCPKNYAETYLLWIINKNNRQFWIGDCLFIDQNWQRRGDEKSVEEIYHAIITHYAEIPPFEVQP